MIKMEFNTRYNIKDKDTSKIFTFFVIETPVSNVSYRSVTFKERNINMSKLTHDIKNEIEDFKNNWIMCKKHEVVSLHNKMNSNFETNIPEEYAIHTKSRDGKTESLYYAIRCALAHGSFDIHKHKGVRYYYLENRDKNIVKAKIVIKEESLLKLIELVENRGNQHEHKRSKN